MNQLKDFKAEDNIIYVPMHAEGNKNHPDCEHGYVTSTNSKFVFCRFYDKHDRLRTVANSEACRPEDLVKNG